MGGTNEHRSTDLLIKLAACIEWGAVKPGISFA
jgi:hypothetical protein